MLPQSLYQITLPSALDEGDHFPMSLPTLLDISSLAVLPFWWQKISIFFPLTGLVGHLVLCLSADCGSLSVQCPHLIICPFVFGLFRSRKASLGFPCSNPVSHRNCKCFLPVWHLLLTYPMYPSAGRAAIPAYAFGCLTHIFPPGVL